MSEKAISLEKFQDGVTKIVDNLKSIDIAITLATNDWVTTTVEEVTTHTQTKNITISSKYENIIVGLAKNASATQIAAAAEAGISSVDYNNGILTIVATKVKPAIDLPMVVQLSTVNGIYESPHYLTIENDIPVATTSIAGKVKPDGTSITVDNDGTIHGTDTTPIATTSVVGKVKPDGETIEVDSNGVISTVPQSTAIKATYDENTALYAHAIDDIIYLNEHFYKATAAISVGDTITIGTNIIAANLATNIAVYIDKLPGGGSSGGGVDIYEDEIETTFSADGKTITEVFSSGTKTTVFNNDGTITETYPDGKSYLTTFNSDGSISKEEITN